MIEDRLRESFRVHEHLADPDRAVAVARATRRTPRRWPVAVTAAAGVIAVVGAIGFLGSGRPGTTPPASRPATTSATPSDQARELDPFGQPIHTDAQNRQATDQQVQALLSQLAAAEPPGTRTRRPADLGPLTDTGIGSSGGTPHVVYWRVPGAGRVLAGWFAAHPMTGFRPEGGPADRIMESGGGGLGWSWAVIFDPVGPVGDQGMTSYQVETTDVGGEALARITVYGTVFPARPRASFAYDVTSVSFVQRTSRWGGRPSHVVRRASIDGAAAVALGAAFNRLHGWPQWYHSCPMTRTITSYSLTFATPSGDLTLRTEIPCYDTWRVVRDGAKVGPVLAGSQELDRLVARLSR